MVPLCDGHKRTMHNLCNRYWHSVRNFSIRSVRHQAVGTGWQLMNYNSMCFPYIATAHLCNEPNPVFWNMLFYFFNFLFCMCGCFLIPFVSRRCWSQLRPAVVWIHLMRVMIASHRMCTRRSIHSTNLGRWRGASICLRTATIT